MATLKAQNYIHTLFLYEFGVSLTTAIAIRTALQTKTPKGDLYLGWIETRLSQTTLPRFRSSLFESEADKTVYFYYGNTNLPHNPTIKYLEILFSTLSTGVCVRLKGLLYGYELVARGNYINPFASFLENRYQVGMASSNWTSLTENEFYTKVERLLDVLVSTNKLPFELHNIQ